jgi:flagellar hook-associated protein 1
VQHIYSQGTDVTGKISAGELGGLLQARDQTLPSMQTQLDSLASDLVQALNTAHSQGFDLNGNPGGNLFAPVSGAGAAASMAVAITDPTLLAASSDGTAGSNGNLANLSAVANQAVSNGMTPIQAYGNLVFQAGSAVSDGTTELNASNTMLQQLQQQQASVSGVSLDEEASNLLLYQRAYQAAAQAISTVDKMLQTAIQMGSGA